MEITKTQECARFYIDKLLMLRIKNDDTFMHDDAVRLRAVIAEYEKAYNNGLFNPEYVERLETAKWNPIANMRYGAVSVYGTYIEVLALVTWNATKTSDTRLRLGNGSKQEETSGCDLRAVYKNWPIEREGYPTQVKSASGLQLGRAVKSNWVKYTTGNNGVERLILVDVRNNTMVHCSYSSFKRAFPVGTVVTIADIKASCKNFCAYELDI